MGRCWGCPWGGVGGGCQGGGGGRGGVYLRRWAGSRGGGGLASSQWAHWNSVVVLSSYRACSFWKAYELPAGQLPQSPLTAAAERSHPHSFSPQHLHTHKHTHTHTHTPASLTYPQVSSLLSWVSVVKLRLDCPRLGQLYWVSFFFFFSFSHWFSLISVFFGMVFPFPPPHPHAVLKNRVDGLKNFTLYRTTRTNTERRLNWEERDRKVS